MTNKDAFSTENLVVRICKAAKAAATALAGSGTLERNAALKAMSEGLIARCAFLKEENAKDMEAGKAKGLSAAMLDRLSLTDARIKQMADGIDEVAALPDPIGGIERVTRRPNDLLVGRMRIPLGVIGIIYESRPNVTADAAALCVKSGNAVVLRGGSEAIHSNAAIAEVLREALVKAGLPADAVSLIPVTDREAIDAMLTQEESIDLIIPRGGEGLIRSVAEKSRIPVIKHYKGVCHIYVDETADIDQSVPICVNSKAQRPGVCNAMETLLVHEAIAPVFLPKVARAMSDAKVKLRGCPQTVRIAPDASPATEEDWGMEYLDLILAVRVVPSMDAAIDHIRMYGSLHTEAILTRDHSRAMRFLRKVDSSLVLVN
ncbi:MAG: glutamate-5-semialdehyde dehydrogenase, partial [Syntrophorhabdaceae bacterium]|nr:glutamate-5-semialdehyde dehydrogenase [Syntrophorhabdaceae bacterium]